MIENIPAGITYQNSASPLNHHYLYQDVFGLIDLFELVYQHCDTPDANSFQLSRSQIISEMGLALQRAVARNT